MQILPKLKSHSARLLSTALMFVAFAGVSLTTGSAAAEYPKKPITIVAPAKAGSSLEIFVRIMQAKMEESLGQPLVISSVPGAGTVTGSRRVKDSDADGYTVLINHLAVHSPYILGKSDFNYKEFAAVAAMFSQPMMVMAKKGTFSSLEDALKQAKANPEKMLAGVNIGGMNHLTVALAESKGDGAKFRYIQTGGTVGSVTSLLGDRTVIGGIGAGGAVKYIGEIDLLAVLDNQRHADYPDVPTLGELGYGNSRLSLDTMFFMPKDTPANVVAKFADAVEAAMNDEDVRANLVKRSLVLDFRRGDAASKAAADGYGSVLEAATAAGLSKR